MNYDTYPPTIKHLTEQTKEYIDTNIDLLKLKAIDKISDVTSSLLAFLAIPLLVFIAVLLVSFGLSFWLGNMLGAWYYGFFITGGLFIILVILIYKFREKWLKIPIADSLIENMFK